MRWQNYIDNALRLVDIFARFRRRKDPFQLLEESVEELAVTVNEARNDFNGKEPKQDALEPTR